MKTHTLIATLVTTYVNANGTRMFMYELSGSAEAIARYEQVKGDDYSESRSGKPAFHTKFVTLGFKGAIDITEKGSIVMDDTEDVMINETIAQCKSPELQKAMAEMYARQKLETITAMNKAWQKKKAQASEDTTAQTEEVTEPVQEPASAEDLNIDEG